MVEARVEYDYDAENEDELSLQVGDIITSVERKEDGWWEGHLRGKVGLFPSNFVKVLNKDQSKQSIRPTKAYSNGVQLRPGNPKTKRKRRCRVVYSYTPVNDDELELEVNNVIEVLEEVEEGWWKGILHGQVGVFPSNFVVEIDDVDEATSENKQVSTSALTDNSDYEIKPKPVRGVDLGIILDDKSIQLKPVHESLDRKSISAAKKPPAPSPPVSLCNDGAPVLPPKPDALLTCSSSADLQISSDNEQDWEYSDYLTSPINMQLKRSAPNVSWQKKEDTNVTRCQSWIETLSNKRSTTEASEAYQVSTCDSQESLELDLHLPISLYENYLALAENHCTVFSSQEPQNWSDDFVLNLRFPKVETSDQKSCIHFQNIYSISAFEENANTECENAYDDMPYCCQYETRDQHNFFGMPILTLGNVFHQFIEEDQFVPEVISEHPDIFKKLKNSKSKQNAFSSQKVNYASDIHHTDNSNTTIAVEQINMDSFDNYNKINSKYLIGKHSKLKKKFLDRSLKTPVKLEIWSMSAEMNKFVVTEHSNIADTLEYLHEEAEIIADNNEGKLHESVSINENSLTTEPMEASSETCDKSIVHEFECKVQSKNNKLPSFVKIIHKMPKHAPKEQTDQFLLDMKNGDKRIRSTYKTSQSSGNMDTFDLQKYSKIPSKSSASNASLDDNDSFPCVINLRDNEKQLLLNLIKSLCNSNVKQREQFESRKILRNSENDFVESETCPTIDNYTDKAKHCNIEVSEDMKVFCTSELDTENHDDSTRHISACKYADTAATSKVSTNSEMYHNVCICNEHIGETICDYVDFRPEKEFAKRPACMKYYFTDSPRLLSGSDQSDFVFKRNRSVQDQFKQNHNKSIESTIKKQLAPPLRNENSESDFSKCQQKGHSFSPASKVKEVKSRNKRVTLQKFGQNLNTSSNSEEKQRIIFQRHQSSENKTINKKRRNAPSKRQHSKRQSLHSNSFKSSNSSNMYNLSNNEVIRELSSETITCCGLRRKRNYHPFRFSIASNDSGYTEDRSFKLEDKEDDLSVKVKARDNEIKLYEENKMRSSYNLNCITNKDYGSNQTFLTPAEKKDVMVMTNEIAYFATQDKMIIPKENIEVQTETDIEDKVSPTQFQESISNVMKVSDEAIKSDCLPVTSDDETNKEIRVQQRENSHSEEQKFIPNGSKSVIKDRNSSSDKLEGVVSTNRGSNSCLQKVCKELEASLSQLAAYESSKPTEVLNILEYLEKRKIKPQTSKLKESIRYLKEYHVYPASISVTSPIRSSRSSYKNRSRRNEEPEKASNQNYGPFDEPCSNSGMFEETSCESVVEVDRSYGPFDDPCDFPYPLQDFREERKAIGSQHTAMKEKSNPGDCYNNRPKLKKNDANEGKSGVKCAASERLRNTCQKPPCICTCQNISPPSKLSYSGPKEDSSSKYSVLREEEERESIISGEVENEVLIESEIGVFGDLDVDSKYYQTVSSASCSECSPLKSYVCFYDEGNKPQRLKSLSGVPCKICSPIRHQKPRFALNKYSQTEKGDAESCSSGSICEICDPYEGFTEMQVVSAFICPNSQQTCSNEKKCPKCHLPRVSEKYNSLPEVSRPSRLNAVNVCKDTCTQTEFQSVRLCSASKDSNSSLDNYNVKVSPDSNYEYQMSQSDYNNKVDHAQSLQEHYKQRLTSQHKSFQTSQHKAIQTSQHKAIQTSQHKAIQASQHKAIQAYQHKCMQTSHHKAIQASHKAIQASNRSVRCHFVERSPSPTEVVTQSGYIEDDYSSPLQRDVLSGDSNSLTCHPPSDQNSSARENSVEYYKDFEQYQHGLRKKSSQRQDNKPSKKESDVCTCNLNATDNRKHNRNKHSEVHHNATYDKTMMLDYSGDMGKKFPQQLENNQIENQFPSKSQGTVIRKYPSLSEIQRIYNSNDNDEGVISRIYEEYVTISMEYPETCQVNKSVQTVECCVQPQRSEVKPGLSSNLHTHPYEGKTSCTCEEKNCYNSFTNKNQCTEAMTLIKYSPQHSSLNGEFSDFSYPSENRYYMEAVYPVSQHGQREPLPNPSSKSFRKGNQPSELQSSNPSRFYPRILNTSQASYSLCAECSKKELLRKVEEKHPVNDETSKLCVCLNNKEKINTDKSILDSVFDRKNKLYRDLKKNTLDAFKQQSPNKNDFDGRSQANKLKEEYPCNCICQKKLEDNTDVISSHAAKSSAIYQVKCSSPVNVPSAESSYLAKKFLETNNIVKDPQRHKVKEKDVRIISEKENTASMLINEGLKENLKQETVPDGSTKKDRLKQQPASSQNPVCNLCRKKPCCCRQVCRTCFQLPCVCIRNCSVCLCTPCICKKKHFKSLVNSIDHSKVVSRNVPKHITIREDNAATATSLPAPDTKAKKHPKSHKCVLRPPHNKKCHKCLNKEERPELEKSKKLSSQNYRNEENGNKLATPCKGTHQDCSCVEILKPKTEPWSSLKNWNWTDWNRLPNDGCLLKAKRTLSFPHLTGSQLKNNKEHGTNETNCDNEANETHSSASLTEINKTALDFPTAFDIINICGSFFDKVFQMYYGNCSCLDSLSYAQRQYDLRLDRNKINIESDCEVQEIPRFKDSLHKFCLASNVYEDLSNSLSPSQNVLSSRRYSRNLNISNSIQDDQCPGKDQSRRRNSLNLPQLPLRKKDKGKSTQSEKSPSDKNFHVYHVSTLNNEKTTATTLLDRFVTKFLGFYDKLKPFPHDICNQCKPVKDLNISKEFPKSIRKTERNAHFNQKEYPKSRTVYYHGTIKARDNKLEIPSSSHQDSETYLTYYTTASHGTLKYSSSELVKQLLESLTEIVVVSDLLRTKEGVSNLEAFVNNRDVSKFSNIFTSSYISDNCSEPKKKDLRSRNHMTGFEKSLSMKKPKRVFDRSGSSRSKLKKNTTCKLKLNKNPVLTNVGSSSANENEKLPDTAGIENSLLLNSCSDQKPNRLLDVKDNENDNNLRKSQVNYKEKSEKSQDILTNSSTDILLMNSFKDKNPLDCMDAINTDGTVGRSSLVTEKHYYSSPSLPVEPLLLGNRKEKVIPAFDSFQKNNLEIAYEDISLPSLSLKESNSCSKASSVTRKKHYTASETFLLQFPQESPETDTEELSDRYIEYSPLINSNSSDESCNKNSSVNFFKIERLHAGEELHTRQLTELTDSPESTYLIKQKDSFPNFQIKNDCESGDSLTLKKSPSKYDVTSEDLPTKSSLLKISDFALHKIKPNCSTKLESEAKEKINFRNDFKKCTETDFKLEEQDCIQNKLNEFSQSSSEIVESTNSELFLPRVKILIPNEHLSNLDYSYQTETIRHLEKTDEGSAISDVLVDNCSSAFSFSESLKEFSKNRKLSITTTKEGNAAVENGNEIGDLKFEKLNNLLVIPSDEMSQSELAIYSDKHQMPQDLCSLNILHLQVPNSNADASESTEFNSSFSRNQQCPCKSSSSRSCLSLEANENVHGGMDIKSTTSARYKNFKNLSLSREMKNHTNGLSSPYNPESYLAHLAKRNLLSPTLQALNFKYGLFENLQLNTSESPATNLATNSDIKEPLVRKAMKSKDSKFKRKHSHDLLIRAFSSDLYDASSFRKYSKRQLQDQDIHSYSV